jgi:hypothetical protein
MKKKWLLISLTGLILLTLIVACSQPTTPEVETDETRALIIDRCSDCHSVDLVFQADYTQEEWAEVIDEMIGKGADVNPEEKAIMIDWLVSQD